MKRVVLSLITLALFTGIYALPASAQSLHERILSYHSDITVNQDGSMLVRETIRVRSTGAEIRHGIYRDFPLRYRDRAGNRYTVGFQVIEVLRDGVPEDYHLARRSNGKRVYIGKKDIYLVPGEYTYALLYRTDRQLGFFADHDELYWNVTGNGWVFPIDLASATVMLPEGAEILSHEAYTGPEGAAARNYKARTASRGVADFATTVPLGAFEGLTIVVSWPKGLVSAPTRVQKSSYFLRDNLGLILGLLGLAGVFLYLLIAWNHVGRDPAKGTIVPLYAPPSGYSPASVRYVSRMGYDNKALAAAVINMAVKRYISISQERNVYTITRDSADESALSPAEQKVAAKLLGSLPTFCFAQENYREISEAIQALKAYLGSKFQRTLFNTNAGLLGLGVLLSCMAIGISLLASLNFMGPRDILFLSALALVFAVLNAVFSRLLKAPTQAGRRVMDEIDGFKMYLAVAEEERLNLLNPPEETPALFEKYLPYALALEVEQRWSERFAAVLARAAARGQEYHPAWYYGSHWDSMHVGGFATSIGSSFAGAISSSAVAPGSSSGGGGGGSSGGGGGGGGGGGW